MYIHEHFYGFKLLHEHVHISLREKISVTQVDLFQIKHYRYDHKMFIHLLRHVIPVLGVFQY